MRTPAERATTLRAFGALVLIVAVLGLIAPRFLSGSNLLAIARQSVPIALASFGQMAAVAAGEIDLAGGSVAALVSYLAVFGAKAYGNGAGWLLGVLAGTALGAFNGLLVARLRIPSFIATVGMLTWVQGVTLLISGGVPVEFPPAGFNLLGQGYLGPLPVPVLVAALCFLLLHVLFVHTTFGRHLFATGANETAAYLSGVDVRRVKFLAMTLSGALTGVAAVVLASRVVSGQPNLDPNLPFEAIAALAVGGVALSGGQGNLLQTVIGVLIFGVLSNGLNLVNVSSYVQQMALGVITVLALVLQGPRALPAGVTRAFRWLQRKPQA